ncbi:MAG: hypothetical protein Kow00107_01370 [Planctomycetota bacterium]
MHSASRSRPYVCTGSVDERGVILITVILILAGLFILALPLAFMAKWGEQSSQVIMRQSEAKAFADMALRHAKNRLRLGIYDNEFNYVYPPPTASPTPTPSYIADRQPYDTPFFDGPAELYFDRVFDMDTLLGEGALDDPNGVIVGIEVEDEQGKLNINSLTPEVLRGLYCVVNGVDPSELDSDELAALNDLFERVFIPMAMKRATVIDGPAPDIYAPLASVEELANVHEIEGSSWYGLTDAEFDRLRRFLTADSWRQYKSGFNPVGTSELKAAYSDSIAIPVQESCLYYVEILDVNDAVLEVRLAEPEVVDDQSYILLEDLPEDSYRARAYMEEVHPVNLNTCAPEVVAALLMSYVDFENLDENMSLKNALDVAMRVRALSSAVALSEDGTSITLDENSSYSLFPENIPWTYSIGGIYAVGVRSGNVITFSEEVGERMAMYSFPLPVHIVFRPDNFNPVQFCNVVLDTANPFTSVFKDLCSRNVSYTRQAPFTVVSYDVYSLKIHVSLNSPEGLQEATWTIKETVELGLSEELKVPLVLDNFGDFEDNLGSTQANGFPRKYKPNRKLSWGGAGKVYLGDGSVPIQENYPPEQVIEWNEPSTRSGKYIRRMLRPEVSTTQSGLNLTIVPGENGKGFKIVGQDGALLERSEISNKHTQYDCPGNVNAEMWIRVKDWDTISSSERMYLYCLDLDYRPDEPAVELYIESSKLVLKATDDISEWGMLTYELTQQNFPENVWMHIMFHVGGNKREQMLLFVDQRPVECTYSSSSERGYLAYFNYIVRSTPTLSLPLAKGDLVMTVTSTSDFPDTGVVQVGDELIAYASKTDTTFDGLTRGVNSTDASDHAVGSRIVSCPMISYHFAFDLNGQSISTYSGYSSVFSAMQKGDEITVMNPAGTPVEKFAIEVVPFNYNSAYWLPLPKDHSFAAADSLSGVVGLSGVSGTIASGKDTASFSPQFFSNKGSNEFTGEVHSFAHFQPDYPAQQVMWFAENISEETTSVSTGGIGFQTTLWGLTSDKFRLFAVNGEILAARTSGFSEEPDTIHFKRGLFGTTPHSINNYDNVTPLTWFNCIPLPMDMDMTSSSFLVDRSNTGVYRVGDELIYFKTIGTRTVDGADYSLVRAIRGYMGSAESSHAKNDLMIQIYPVGQVLYDPLGDEYTQEDYVEFIRRSSSTRYHGITWNVLNPDERVRTHCSLSTTYRRVMPFEDIGDLFHFTSDDTDLSISHSDGSAVMADSVLVRFTVEFLDGAWLPDDPTRHSWKNLPVLDKIELWIEQQDTVYRHSEGP